MKFGGTSVAGTERIRRVANIVRAQAAGGNQVAVVVSAMAGETDRLVTFCREANPLYDPAEYDVVVASGEQVTSGLLALTLQSMGCKARSWLGWQLPVKTFSNHANARVDEIDAERLLESMTAGEIAVIPGFQGVSDEGRITTMGRGGSDTSAVAVAAAIGADRCDIYTDVDGVYTTDPRIVARARKIKHIAFEEMLELASVGAKVLQTRSVSMAMKHNVPVQVLSSFVDEDSPPADSLPGTMIVSESEMAKLLEEAQVERQTVTGIAHDKNEARVVLTRGAAPEGVIAIAAPQEIAGLDSVLHLYVEGGAQTAAAFLEADLVDELHLYRAPILIGDGRRSLGALRLENLDAAHGLWQLAERRQLGSDSFEAYLRSRDQRG